MILRREGGGGGETVLLGVGFGTGIFDRRRFRGSLLACQAPSTRVTWVGARARLMCWVNIRGYGAWMDSRLFCFVCRLRRRYIRGIMWVNADGF